MAPSELHDKDQSAYPGVYKQSSTSLSHVILTQPPASTHPTHGHSCLLGFALAITPSGMPSSPPLCCAHLPA